MKTKLITILLGLIVFVGFSIYITPLIIRDVKIDKRLDKIQDIEFRIRQNIAKQEECKLNSQIWNEENHEFESTKQQIYEELKQLNFMSDQQ